MFNINQALKNKATAKDAASKLINVAMAAGRDLKGTELTQYNGLVAEIQTIDAQISEHQAGATFHTGGAPHGVINVEGSYRPQPGTSQTSGNGLRDLYNRAGSELRAQIDGLGDLLAGRRITALANLSPAADGAIIIPADIIRTFEKNFFAFTPVVNVARIYGTDTGDNVTFPVLNDTEAAVQLAPAAATGADATVSGDTPPTSVTGPVLKAWKVSSKPVFLSRELITDSPIDVINDVLGALLARIARFENLKYTVGGGSTEAEGFITAATKYVAGAVALDLDVALDLAYSVPQQFRINGAYMATDSTIKYLRKLHTGVSGDKRSLWRDSFDEGNAALGTPAKLHGYPIYVNNDMDSVASDGTFASANVLAFGDFSKFVVRQAEQNRPYTYIYPVPAKDGRAVVIFRRSDSNLLIPTAINRLVVS